MKEIEYYTINDAYNDNRLTFAFETRTLAEEFVEKEFPPKFRIDINKLERLPEQFKDYVDEDSFKRGMAGYYIRTPAPPGYYQFQTDPPRIVRSHKGLTYEADVSVAFTRVVVKSQAEVKEPNKPYIPASCSKEIIDQSEWLPVYRYVDTHIWPGKVYIYFPVEDEDSYNGCAERYVVQNHHNIHPKTLRITENYQEAKTIDGEDPTYKHIGD